MTDKSENVLLKTLNELNLKTKTGWVNIAKFDATSIQNLAKNTIKKLRNNIEDANVKPKSGTPEKTWVTIGVKRNQRNEEILERLIYLTNKEKVKKDASWENQFAIVDIRKPSHIDLKYETLNELRIIELKQWPYKRKDGYISANNPAHAAVEAVKNYFAYEKTKKMNGENLSVEKIVFTVLAPSAYYDYFKNLNPNAWQKFEGYLQKLTVLLNKELSKDVVFEIKEINLSKGIFDKFIEEQDKNKNKDNKINLAEKCCINSVIFQSEIENLLKFECWIDVLNPKPSDIDASI